MFCELRLLCVNCDSGYPGATLALAPRGVLVLRPVWVHAWDGPALMGTRHVRS